jgi:hypothetical protein
MTESPKPTTFMMMMMMLHNKIFRRCILKLCIDGLFYCVFYRHKGDATPFKNDTFVTNYIL